MKIHKTLKRIGLLNQNKNTVVSEKLEKYQNYCFETHLKKNVFRLSIF